MNLEYSKHTPVLLKEVLEYLNPSSGENFIDCTFGFGGHSLEILERIAPEGKVLGIEREEKVADQCKKKKGLVVAVGNFIDIKEIVRKHGFRDISGILFDLGLSSWQIDESGRGFSFQKDEPLLMNFSGSGLTAEEVVNKYSERRLAEIIKEFGEERYARSIAHSICLFREKARIKTTARLVAAIKEGVPVTYHSGRIHFATRTFQAIRIEVNQELNNLYHALSDAFDLLEKDGRLVVISFHSLEDRIVKHFFKDQSKKDKLKILTKKPVRPSLDEIRFNPRSRSAKLRAVCKL